MEPLKDVTCISWASTVLYQYIFAAISTNLHFMSTVSIQWGRTHVALPPTEHQHCSFHLLFARANHKSPTGTLCSLRGPSDHANPPRHCYIVIL